MRVHTTKATWFRALLCGLAALQIDCRKEPAPVAEGFCSNDGVVSSRNLERAGTGQVAAEIVQSCGDCQRSVRAGAAPGSPCGAASVCQEVCCECPNSFSKSYRARVCDAGKCAGQQSCDLARTAIHPDVCSSAVPPLTQ